MQDGTEQERPLSYAYAASESPAVTESPLLHTRLRILLSAPTLLMALDLLDAVELMEP
jgi:hypothetical protein